MRRWITTTTPPSGRAWQRLRASILLIWQHWAPVLVRLLG